MLSRQSHLLSLGSFVILSCFVSSCSESNGPEDERLFVGGTYATQVSLTQNSCTGINVQPLPTTVSHAEGATTLSIQHGPLTYTGTVSSSGSFTTTPNVVQDPPAGIQTTLTIAGQFSRTGFVADVTANVLKNTPPDCAYTVHWIGTKQGSVNVIP